MMGHKIADVVDFRHELAIRHWREGRYDEARATLKELLEERHRLSPDMELRCKINLGLIECDAGRLDESLQVLLSAATLAELTKDLTLKAKFHNELAITHRQLGNLDGAFQEYTAAGYWHEKAGNLKYCADVENNLGNLLVDAKEYIKAIEHLDTAERLFTHLNDHAAKAQVEDTRARAYLAAGEPDLALDAAIRSVAVLKTLNEPRLMLESLATLALVCEGKRIHDALVENDGSITHAAHSLGIPHNTSLNYLLNKKFPQFLHLRRAKTHSRVKRA